MIVERIYDPQNDLQNALNTAKDADCTRDDMADFYADLIRCGMRHGNDSIDWKVINEAILKRWPKGLTYIKTKAWRQLKARGQS